MKGRQSRINRSESAAEQLFACLTGYPAVQVQLIHLTSCSGALLLNFNHVPALAVLIVSWGLVYGADDGFLCCTCLSLFTDKEMAQITASCLPEIALLTPRINSPFDPNSLGFYILGMNVLFLDAEKYPKCSCMIPTRTVW